MTLLPHCILYQHYIYLFAVFGWDLDWPACPPPDALPSPFCLSSVYWDSFSNHATPSPACYLAYHVPSPLPPPVAACQLNQLTHRRPPMGFPSCHLPGKFLWAAFLYLRTIATNHLYKVVSHTHTLDHTHGRCDSLSPLSLQDSLPHISLSLFVALTCVCHYHLCLPTPPFLYLKEGKSLSPPPSHTTHACNLIPFFFYILPLFYITCHPPCCDLIYPP